MELLLLDQVKNYSLYNAALCAACSVLFHPYQNRPCAYLQVRLLYRTNWGVQRKKLQNLILYSLEKQF